MEVDILRRRLDSYINSERACPMAIILICELRAQLRAVNRAAERNMQIAMIFLNKNDELNDEMRKLLSEAPNDRA